MSQRSSPNTSALKLSRTAVTGSKRILPTYNGFEDTLKTIVKCGEGQKKISSYYAIINFQLRQQRVSLSIYLRPTTQTMSVTHRATGRPTFFLPVLVHQRWQCRWPIVLPDVLRFCYQFLPTTLPMSCSTCHHHLTQYITHNPCSNILNFGTSSDFDIRNAV